MKSRIGILGGTFDPIHIGHLMLAECAREELGLDEVWLIPTGCSYQKKERSDGGQHLPTPAERLHMTELAIRGVPGFRCLDIEVKRGGDTYSYETLEELHALYPDREFFFIVGADCLFSIEGWKYPERIFRDCTIAAALRDDSDIEVMEAKAGQLQESYHARIVLLHFRRMQISSTEIRERAKSGKSIRFMVPDRLATYINDKGFYRDENS